MEHMVYVGEDSDLQGKTALVRREAPADGYALAQFDDYETKRALGWFPFKADEFETVGGAA